MGLLLRLLAVPAVLLGLSQATEVTDAATALRSDPVYREDGADVISEDQADELRQRIEDTGAPVRIAIFRQATVDDAGGPDAALRALIDDTGLSGAYALVSDENFRTGPPGRAAELGTAAIAAERSNGPMAVLEEYVARVGRSAAGGSSGSSGSSGSNGSSESDGDGGGSLMPLLLVGGAAVGGVFLFTQSRKNKRVRAEQQQALQGAQQDLLAELSVLADDVLRLEPEVNVHPEARPDYEAAVSRYKWLEAAIPQIDSPDDPPRIQRAMTEARYAMARAEAIARGVDPPAPPAELTHAGRYGEPAIEIDERDEYRRPRYAGYDGYEGGGWYGGGYFGGNGLFTGLLLGHMLGGGFGGWGGGFGGDNDDDSGGGDSGWGGGDFGGGDFGGGDFGGGDFGGGDW